MEFFDGIFDHLGIRVQETGDVFTIHHQGDKFTLTEGVEAGKVDFVVDLKTQNITNMIRHAEDGKIDRKEAFAIVSVMFSPLTRASLDNPLVRSPLLRRMLRIENLIHVHLLDPEGGSSNSHTLIHVNKQWIVAPGLWGEPLRTFRIDIDQAVEYQKHVHQAMKQNSLGGWLRFGSWYRNWRQRVS